MTSMTKRTDKTDRPTGMMGKGHEIHTRRLDRNLAIGGALFGIVALIFAVTMVKLGNGAMIQGFDHTYETVPAVVGE